MGRRAIVKQDVEIVVWGSDDDTGFEDTETSDYAMPMLSVLQALSPQCKKSNAKYHEDAEPGHLFITGLDRPVENLEVVPCYYKKEFVEWIPIDMGGGFVATHALNSGVDKGAQRIDGKMFLENGHELVTTAYFYCVVIDTLERVVIPLASTGLKVARSWMSKANAVRVDSNPVPLFAQVYKASSILESNPKGEWYTLKTEYSRVATPKEFEHAKQFRAQLKEEI